MPFDPSSGLWLPNPPNPDAQSALINAVTNANAQNIPSYTGPPITYTPPPQNPMPAAAIKPPNVPYPNISSPAIPPLTPGAGTVPAAQSFRGQAPSAPAAPATTTDPEKMAVQGYQQDLNSYNALINAAPQYQPPNKWATIGAAVLGAVFPGSEIGRIAEGFEGGLQQGAQTKYAIAEQQYQTKLGAEERRLGQDVTFMDAQERLRVTQEQDAIRNKLYSQRTDILLANSKSLISTRLAQLGLSYDRVVLGYNNLSYKYYSQKEQDGRTSAQINAHLKGIALEQLGATNRTGMNIGERTYTAGITAAAAKAGRIYTQKMDAIKANLGMDPATRAAQMQKAESDYTASINGLLNNPRPGTAVADIATNGAAMDGLGQTVDDNYNQELTDLASGGIMYPGAGGMAPAAPPPPAGVPTTTQPGGTPPGGTQPGTSTGGLHFLDGRPTGQSATTPTTQTAQQAAQQHHAFVQGTEAYLKQNFPTIGNGTGLPANEPDQVTGRPLFGEMKGLVKQLAPSIPDLPTFYSRMQNLIGQYPQAAQLSRAQLVELGEDWQTAHAHPAAAAQAKPAPAATAAPTAPPPPLSPEARAFAQQRYAALKATGTMSDAAIRNEVAREVESYQQAEASTAENLVPGTPAYNRALSQVPSPVGAAQAVGSALSQPIGQAPITRNLESPQERQQDDIIAGVTQRMHGQPPQAIYTALTNAGIPAPRAQQVIGPVRATVPLGATVPYTNPMGGFRTWRELITKVANEVATQEGFAPNQHFPELVAALMNSESGGNAQATSTTGAMGAMQVEPGTAQTYGFDPKQLHDPVYGTIAGVTILGKLLTAYHGNIRNALAAYNMGQGALAQNRGIPYPSTSAYINRILHDYFTLIGSKAFPANP